MSIEDGEEFCKNWRPSFSVKFWIGCKIIYSTYFMIIYSNTSDNGRIYYFVWLNRELVVGPKSTKFTFRIRKNSIKVDNDLKLAAAALRTFFLEWTKPKIRIYATNDSYLKKGFEWYNTLLYWQGPWLGAINFHR